jgi:hypothetical protein
MRGGATEVNETQKWATSKKRLRTTALEYRTMDKVHNPGNPEWYHKPVFPYTIWKVGQMYDQVTNFVQTVLPYQEYGRRLL